MGRVCMNTYISRYRDGRQDYKNNLVNDGVNVRAMCALDIIDIKRITRRYARMNIDRQYTKAN